MSLKSHLLIAAIACIGGLSLSAQTTVTTDPVGFTTTSCLGNSDTYLGIPFTRPPEFTGTVQSVNGSTLTVNGNLGWTVNQFVYSAGMQPKHYYVLIGNGGASNPKEGHIYPVAGNGSNTLNVDATFDDLTGVTANTQITLIPYWTPATIFPPSDAGISFTPTSSPPSYQTLLRVPNYSAPGINQPYAAEYYFNNGSWQRVSPAGVGDDDPLLPDGYFIVRNANGAPTLPLTALGSVLMKKLAVPILTASNQQQDNAVAMIRPVAVSLDFTGLAPFDRSFGQNDQLLLFDNSQPGFDKTPIVTYIFNGGWRLIGDPNTERGTDLIAPGRAMLVRKAAISGGLGSWVNGPTYVPGEGIRPLQVASRKVHGTAGTFSVNLPVTGNYGIEPRRGGTSGKDFEVIATFPTPLASLVGASVSSRDNLAGVDQPVVTTSNGHGVVTLSLHNVTNGQLLRINLFGANDGTNAADFAIPMGVLLGDMNGTRTVEGNDVSVVQAHTRQRLDSSNFLYDVNVNGAIEGNDVSMVQQQTRTSIH